MSFPDPKPEDFQERNIRSQERFDCLVRLGLDNYDYKYMIVIVSQASFNYQSLAHI